MAARTKVDLSDDPMASLFEDDFVPASKTAPAPVAQAAEEPELRALDFSKVAIKGAAAPPKPAPTAAAPPSDRVVREDLHGDDVRMGLGVDFSSLAPAVGASSAALADGAATAGAGDLFGGAAAAPAPDADADLFGEARAPQGVVLRSRSDDAAIDDLLVGKILEKEDFSGLAADDSLFGASDVKRAGAPPPPAARPAKRGRPDANGGAETSPQRLAVDTQQEKYSVSLLQKDKYACQPVGKMAKPFATESLIHRSSLRLRRVNAAVDWDFRVPAPRTQLIGMCKVDPRLRRIYKDSMNQKRSERLGYINRRVWGDDGGALGRDLLCREYGIPEAVGLTDAQFAALGGLWTIDGMWNKIELPLEALVLRPMTAHLRWMYEGSTTMKEEVKRYYGAPRFKIATRSASRATTKAKELEQACL